MADIVNSTLGTSAAGSGVRHGRRPSRAAAGIAVAATCVLGLTIPTAESPRPPDYPGHVREAPAAGTPAPQGQIEDAGRVGGETLPAGSSVEAGRDTPRLKSPALGPLPAQSPVAAGPLLPRDSNGPVASPLVAVQAAMLDDMLRSAEAIYGSPAAQTASSDPLFSAVDVSKLPMGMQNSNPGNIKFVAGNFWKGQVGPSYNTDQGDPQVVFDNAADGMLAAAQLILQRFHWGHDTVRKLIADRRVGWTPGYVAGAEGVAAGAGFRLDQELDFRDPKVLARLLRGLVVQEHGPAGNLYPAELIQAAAAEALG